MKKILVILIILSAAGMGTYYVLEKNNPSTKDSVNAGAENPNSTPALGSPIASPTGDKGLDKNFTYDPPELEDKEAYTFILVGDSMVDTLGENLTQLRRELKGYYPEKTFGLFNYGFGSTTLTSLMDRLTTTTEYRGKKFEPILNRQFDVIIIESFGHNPLSQYEIEEGLRKQEQILTETVERIQNGHPDSVIVFLATIGANKNNYALGVKDLSMEQRQEWAEERNSYIRNHIEYANEHNIPVINVYEQSFNRAGVVDPAFINPDSWIHPSQLGIHLISESIAEYIFENSIVPRD